MKKLFLLAFVAVLGVSIMSSCSDDKNDNVNNSIVGTWKLTSEEAVVETNNALLTEALKARLLDSYTGVDNNCMFKFNTDGTLLYTEKNDDDITGTYTYDKKTLTITYRNGNIDGDDDIEICEATVTNNTLIMDYDDTADYQSEADINYIIRNNEKLKGIDPSTLKVTKAVLREVFTRQ